MAYPTPGAADENRGGAAPSDGPPSPVPGSWRPVIQGPSIPRPAAPPVVPRPSDDAPSLVDDSSPGRPLGSAPGPLTPLARADAPFPAPVAATEDKPAKRGNLFSRVLVAVILIAALLASLAFQTWIFAVFVAVAVCAAVYEIGTAFRSGGIRIPVVPLAVCGVGMQLAAYFAGIEALLVGFVVTLAVTVAWRVVEGTGARALGDALAGVFAAAYIPLLAGFVVLISAQDGGAWRVLYVIAASVASDTGGYAVGVLIGRHPMAPTISPKKSWEGFAGSLILGVAVTSVGMWLLHGEVWMGAVFGVLAVGASTLGDLGESLIKRDLGLKDMSSILGGHGGVLDRVDSILMTAPLGFVALMLALPA